MVVVVVVVVAILVAIVVVNDGGVDGGFFVYIRLVTSKSTIKLNLCIIMLSHAWCPARSK